MRPTGLSSAVMSKKTRGSAMFPAAAAILRRSVSWDGRLGRAVAPKWLDCLKVESIDSRQIDLNAIFCRSWKPAGNRFHARRSARYDFRRECDERIKHLSSEFLPRNFEGSNATVSREQITPWHGDRRRPFHVSATPPRDSVVDPADAHARADNRVAAAQESRPGGAGRVQDPDGGGCDRARLNRRISQHE
ncbi:Uncharacterized protein DBV15_06103 [Temnothorax longispinosus]|uniref:Uncharacterized protein n=1 Tax=Temnothorax longispinosus TaxID=300112 RepID=A0A4S2KDI6_9HYME|nr:Uncharacterized protein DBV15_06103 [Temnothorax longispinosus]